MTRILSIDPSGTGTSGIYYHDGNRGQFIQHIHQDWKKHYDFIAGLVKVYHPNILLYEHTNYVGPRGKDMTSLFKLLGAMEMLPVESMKKVPVNQVKELRNKLLKGKHKIEGLEYQPGKGWHCHQKKISTHGLDAYLIYWLWKKKPNPAC